MSENNTEGDQESGSIIDRGGVDTDARAGRTLGIDLEQPPAGMTEDEIEEERRRRLDPDSRPEGAEVDNTDRTFDHERGTFTDAEDYDETERRFPDAEEAEDAEG